MSEWRHRENERCGSAVVGFAGPCGYERWDPIHDKPFGKPRQHEFSDPTPDGSCAHCRKSWPCDAETQRLRAEASERKTERLVTALGTHFLTDGSPCFCSRWDAIYGNGDVVHQPRCRMGRMALDFSGEPRTVGCAAPDGECKGRSTGGVPHDVAPVAARSRLRLAREALRAAETRDAG